MGRPKTGVTKSPIDHPADLLSSHPSLIINYLDQHGYLLKTGRDLLISAFLKPKFFKSGASIRLTDLPKIRFVVLLRGYATYWRVLPDGRRQIISVMLAGDEIFEHLNSASLMEDRVSALTDVEIAVVTDDDINFFEASQTGIKRVLSESRSLWIRNSSIERISSLTGRTATERVSAVLYDIFIRSRQVTYIRGLTCSIPLTQLDLGNYTGLSHVHVCRSLAILKNDDVLTFSNTVLRITNLSNVKKIVYNDIFPLNDSHDKIIYGGHEIDNSKMSIERL